MRENSRTISLCLRGLRLLWLYVQRTRQKKSQSSQLADYSWRMRPTDQSAQSTQNLYQSARQPHSQYYQGTWTYYQQRWTG